MRPEVARLLWRKIQFGARNPSFLRFLVSVEQQTWQQNRTCTLFSTQNSSKDKGLTAIMKGLNLEELKKQLPVTSNRSTFTIAVEGNIGCGKSTLLKHFENLPYTEILCEPLDKWTDVNGHNALSLLYEDSERWSFSFNMYAMLTRLQQHVKPHTMPVKLLERSLYSTRYCFVQNNFQDKTINGFEYSVLNQWFDYLVKSGKAEIDLIVYLRADPETCYQRLKKRSRKEESSVPYSLLDSLHNLHDDWLINKKYPTPAPVLILDANYDLEKMKETYDLRRTEILCGYS